MKQLSLQIKYLSGSSLCLGRVGEQNAAVVTINTQYWTSRYPDITLRGLYQRPDGTKYAIQLVQIENGVKWYVTRKDLYKAGNGYLTLFGYQGESAIISARGILYILPGVNGQQQDVEKDTDPNTEALIEAVFKASASATKSALIAEQCVETIKDYFILDDDGNFTIPIATGALLGLVKSSEEPDKIFVGQDGTMNVNSININKLYIGTGDTFTLECGSSNQE